MSNVIDFRRYKLSADNTVDISAEQEQAIKVMKRDLLALKNQRSHDPSNVDLASMSNRIASALSQTDAGKTKA